MLARGNAVAAVTSVLAFIAALASAVAVPEARAQQDSVAVPLQSSDRDLQLCVDGNGEPKPGEIDVLLLIDDSGSLEGTRNPTDPEKRRFEALDAFLSGLGAMGGDARPVNIAAVTFGATVSVELGFRPLVAAEVDGIVADLRSVATGRQRLTLYGDGIRRAVQLLADRPAQNCRFLVFFTDGGHDASNRSSETIDADDAADLRRQFCRPGGLRDDLRLQNINMFVLLLTPPEDNPLRLEASKDVMQVLTGDPRPAFVGQDGVPRAVPRDPVDDCSGPIGPRTGLILPVAEASQLPGLFADLPNIAGGGVAPIECPYTVGDVTTEALPNGHLIDWLSLTDYGAFETPRAPTLRNLVVIIDGERSPAETFLEPLSESPPSARFRVRDDARDGLVAGWTIQVIDAQDLCLRLRPVVPEFRLSTGEPQISASRPSGLPEELYDSGQLELLEASTRSRLTIDEALRTARVTGRLSVVNGELFAVDGFIPTRIVVDGAPRLGPGCSSLQIPAPGTIGTTSARGAGAEAPSEALVSSTCEITPATLGDGGSLSWERTIVQLNSGPVECRAGEFGGGWQVFVDGAPMSGTELRLTAGGAPVTIELRSTPEPENAEVDCNGAAVAPVEFAWQGRTSEIPIALSVSWLKRSSPFIAALIATPLMLLVVLLSLALLWFMNERLMRPPNPSRLWGMEASGTLELDRRGTGRIVWEEGEGEGVPVVTSDTLQRVSAFGRGGLRTEGHARLARTMPPLHRPLSEPVLELETEGSGAIAVSEPPAPVGSGALPMGFRNGAILSTRATRPPDAEAGVPVRLVVLVPMDSDLAGSEAVASFLDQHLDGLIDRLLARLREVAEQGGGPRTGSQGLPPDTGPSGPMMDDMPPGGPPPLDGPPD